MNAEGCVESSVVLSTHILALSTRKSAVHVCLQVHINQWRYEAYRELPAVLSCVTATGSDTRVHACRAVVSA